MEVSVPGRKIRKNAKNARTNETEKDREERLRKAREYQKKRLAAETQDEREKRLRALREYQKKRLALETPDERTERLRKLREYQKKRLASETPKEKEFRLKRSREKKKKPTSDNSTETETKDFVQLQAPSNSLECSSFVGKHVASFESQKRTDEFTVGSPSFNQGLKIGAFREEPQFSSMYHYQTFNDTAMQGTQDHKNLMVDISLMSMTFEDHFTNLAMTILVLEFAWLSTTIWFQMWMRPASQYF